MSLFDYRAAAEIASAAPPFAALIMAATLRGDTTNVARLAAVFPELVTETRRRYQVPGGRLAGDGAV